MPRRRTVPSFEPQHCAWCGRPMSERRPPRLIRTSDAVFIGPYHAVCAERLRIEYEKCGELPSHEHKVYGKEWTGPAEERLPW